MDLILVKLGGGLITDKYKPYTANYEIIKRLIREIHEAREEKDFDLIVGHGGGSFPHTSAAKYQTQKGIVNEKSWEGFARVQNDAAKLNRIVVDTFLEVGENAVSIQPSACCIAEDSKIVDWCLEPIKKTLESNLLPVPYGDVAFDLKQGCCIISTEEILRFLAEKLGGKKVIMVGKDDVLINGSRVPKITPNNFDRIEKYLRGSEATDVTGGMRHKVEQMLELANKNIKGMIINGSEANNLRDALLGDKIGTIVEL